MAASKYGRLIVDTLEGRTDELRAIAAQRRDWAGSGALLELYHASSGRERGKLIQAMGEVIQDHPASAAVLAQLVNVAAGLDLAEVEPQVRKLQGQEVAREEPLRSAIRNYLAFRNLNTLRPLAAKDSRSPDGKASATARKARNTRRTSA